MLMVMVVKMMAKKREDAVKARDGDGSGDNVDDERDDVFVFSPWSLGVGV